MAWGAEKLGQKKAADGIWTGTVVGVAADMVKLLLDSFAPGVSASLGLSGMGSMSDRMKDVIMDRVRGNLSGVGSYLNLKNASMNVARPINGLGATYVTTKMGRAMFDPTPRLSMAGSIADDSITL